MLGKEWSEVPVDLKDFSAQTLTYFKYLPIPLLYTGSSLLLLVISFDFV